jgi:predicted permease
MSWFDRLVGSLRKNRLDDQLDDELRFHIEMRTREFIAEGMTPDEARRRAWRVFGNQVLLKEQTREMDTLEWIESLGQDLRYAGRMLRKSPAFAVVAIMTLALGIGVNTAIFSMVNALVFRKLPVPAPDQMVSLLRHDKTQGFDDSFSYPDFEDIRSQSAAVFRDMACTQIFQSDGFGLNGHTEPMWTNFVTNNFFQLMGVQPALGRLFQASDGKLASADPVLVLGYSFWRTHLDGDPSVIGKNATINGHPVTIIGVAPQGFYGTISILDTQGYLPLGMASVTADSKSDSLTDRKSVRVEIVGRLKPGVSIDAAQPVLNVIARRLSQQYPAIHNWDSLRALSMRGFAPPDGDSPQVTVNAMAIFFLALVLVVLVLACLNVANLLLVRAAARQREIAVRAALGAGRARLVRQMLTESLLLAFAGCVGGILLGLGVSRAIGSINLTSAIPIVFDFSFDWSVFTYAFGVALLTGVLVGITPAVRVMRGNLSDILHESARGSTARRQRARSMLVVAELSGSLVLLIVAGLFVRSVQSVQRSDLGFQPEHVVNLTIAPVEAGYDETAAKQFLRDLLQRASTLPGIESAALAASVPMGYYSYGAPGLKIEGYEPARGEELSAGWNAVSPAYFQTMGIRLLRGRAFLDSDTENSPHVAVINEEMARRWWPHRDPIGRHFTLYNRETQVVGIVRNSRTGNMSGRFKPYFYRAIAQDYETPITLQLRSGLPSAEAIRVAVATIDSLSPAMPVFEIHTMTQALDTLNGYLLYKIGALLTAALGLLGLSLALVGVYGVVSYAASQRTHEIGIRMALGARPSQVLQTILGQGFVMTGAGVLIGISLAAGASRLSRDMLASVSPIDPISYGSASLLLALVALTACYIPARRAANIEPMSALRSE